MCFRVCVYGYAYFNFQLIHETSKKIDFYHTQTGFQHTLMLAEDGEVYVCGKGSTGCLGLLTEELPQHSKLKIGANRKMYGAHARISSLLVSFVPSSSQYFLMSGSLQVQRSREAYSPTKSQQRI